MHAILGASDACIAVHPSDMCVAMAMLEANVYVTGVSGDRLIPFADFPAAGRYAETRHQPRRQRDHHRGGAAAPGLREELYVS
jgi:hypothetical protein